MRTFLMILRLMPVILPLIRAVEDAFPLPGKGREKLAFVLDLLRQVYDASDDLSREFSFDRLAAVVVPIIARFVGLSNALGLFRKST